MLYRANFRSGCQEVLCQIPYRSLSILCRHSYLCQPNLRAHQKNNAGFSHPQRLQSKPISGASPGSLHPKRCRPLGLGLQLRREQPKLPYQEPVPLQRSLHDFEIKGSWSEILTPNPVSGCGRWSGVGKAWVQGRTLHHVTAAFARSALLLLLLLEDCAPWPKRSGCVVKLPCSPQRRLSLPVTPGPRAQKLLFHGCACHPHSPQRWGRTSLNPSLNNCFN